mmetsp:Transcript_30623/g.62043  ORF Transcript_30623/g.62043 Transcript_30623/m.62043 type:complete len:686 (+) Transcript_30623:143-2200(+)
MAIFRPLSVEITLCVYLVSFVVTAQQSAATEDAADLDPVNQAIVKCRLRLKDRPFDMPYAFPKTQYRLALLLESRLPSPAGQVTNLNKEWREIAREIAQLYEHSAHNETHGFKPSVRVEALTKAASILLEADGTPPADDSIGTAKNMLNAALDITRDDVDEQDPQMLISAHAAAFEKLVQLLLDQASDKRKGNTDERAYLEMALQLCEKCTELTPNEPVIDEYRGVVLRRLHNTRGIAFAESSILTGKGASDEPQEWTSSSSAAEEVHSAYESAAKKSHGAAIVSILTPEALSMSRYPCGTLRHKYGKKLPASTQLRQPTESDDVALLSSLWTRLVRHIVLAAAAAREGGLRNEEDKHISYGLAIVSHLTLSEFVRPDVQADLLINAGIRHKARGETKEAARYFRAALEASPGDGHAVVQLASLGDNEATPVTSLSDSYVADLFDGYSARFEKELVEDLGYRGHEIVADAILRHWGSSRIARSSTGNDIVIVDIGCGTGLLGSLLRQRMGAVADETCKASRMPQKVIIHGVDLSSRMVDISRGRTAQINDTSGNNHEVSVYDSVRRIDASAFLESLDSASVDVITASDVFIYIGALDTVFRECSRVLKKGGFIAFTVEVSHEGAKKESDKEGLMLMQSGRFSHSKDYIGNVAKQVGLVIVGWKDEVLRKQGKDDVKGAVVTVQML